ncbi:hypothetical protein [Streptomyces incanus]|uniref:Uncharacterized protein n=1 Tax=Streptomyces incanus TaxID=887453 RepID=A0ABW0XMV2_9ACTN
MRGSAHRPLGEWTGNEAAAPAGPFDDQQRTAAETLCADHVRQPPDLAPREADVRGTHDSATHIQQQCDPSDAKKIGGLNLGLRIMKT